MDYGWKLCEKKKKSDAWWKDGRSCQRWKKKKKKKEKEKKKRKEKSSFVFLRFYVDGVWNQMKLSIGA